MNERKRAAIAVSLAAMIAAASAPCRAGSVEAEAKSRRLFEEADDLASHGQLGEACPLFKAAHELHATGGTALRTADCYEKLAKLDLALLHYQYILEHRDLDKEPARVALAEERVATLRKKLGLDQPALPPVRDVKPLPPPLVPDRLPAYIALGAGGAGLVVGGVLGGLALAQAGTVRSNCPTHHCPDQRANAAAATAKAWGANVGLGLGLAGVATGVVLFVLGLPKVPQVAQGALGPDGVTVRF